MITPGDVVLVSSRGRLFYGRVPCGPRAAGWLWRRSSVTFVRVDDVVEHWSRAGTAPIERPTPRAAAAGGVGALTEQAQVIPGQLDVDDVLAHVARDTPAPSPAVVAVVR